MHKATVRTARRRPSRGARRSAPDARGHCPGTSLRAAADGRGGRSSNAVSQRSSIGSATSGTDASATPPRGRGGRVAGREGPRPGAASPRPCRRPRHRSRTARPSPAGCPPERTVEPGAYGMPRSPPAPASRSASRGRNTIRARHRSAIPNRCEPRGRPHPIRRRLFPAVQSLARVAYDAPVPADIADYVSGQRRSTEAIADDSPRRNEVDRAVQRVAGRSGHEVSAQARSLSIPCRFGTRCC